MTSDPTDASRVTSFRYDAAPIRVRDDIPAAHRRAWERLAAPGSWWSGDDRVAIAAEVRNAAGCGLCAERKAALSPHAVEGGHDDLGALPGAAVDVIHRVTTDPGRLSKTWFEKSLAGGLSEGHYVELLGVVVMLVSIDTFHRAMGLPLEPLPQPLPGEPSAYRPPGTAPEGAWVPMLRRARGREADLWKNPTGNVIRAMSLVPDAVRQLTDLSAAHYLSMDDFMDARAGRSLSRAQMELVAGRVSALNECFY